nr:hypothetical protein [Pyrobaculum islandicum]
MDIRVLAKLVASKVGEEPVDLDKILESIGVEMSWIDKITLVQNMEDIEAVYHAVSGKILIRRINH